jgi:hypothetical protein
MHRTIKKKYFKGRDFLRHLGIAGEIMLESISNKWCVSRRTEFVWLIGKIEHSTELDSYGVHPVACV